jgi:glyoxylase-like metal-dependent hydrolase (beta-lactamase superfamily II)
MRPARFVLAVAAFVLVLAPGSAQDRFADVKIEAKKVAEGIYMLTGAGGNIGVSVGDDGIVVIDDQFAELAPKIREALRGIADKPVRYVLNTHYHGDHTGGNAAFAAAGSTLIAQENVRKRLAEGTTARGRKEEPAAPAALPVITFGDRLTVHLNGEDIRAIHFPAGHTDGDAVIFFPKANVVHMGDDLWTHGGFPFVDTENGGSVSGMIAGCEKVLASVPADAKFIPGHGDLSTADDVRKFVKVLSDTRAAVAAAVGKGLTPEQMKEQKILAQWDEFGQQFIKIDAWIDTLYLDVTKH